MPRSYAARTSAHEHGVGRHGATLSTAARARTSASGGATAKPYKPDSTTILIDLGSHVCVCVCGVRGSAG